MAIPATQMRPGMIIKHNDQLHLVFKVEHRTPGNLRAFIQAKLRNLKSGAMFEHRFRSADTHTHSITLPTIAVASMFQKEPQVLIAHPDRGVNDIRDLKNLILYVSKEGMASYFQWLKADYGMTDAQVRPYTFNPQPFLADRNSAMQGYVTSEPYAIETQAGFKPRVFLLADQGFGRVGQLHEVFVGIGYRF